MTQLNHLRPKDSAAKDGVLMFQDGHVVVSVGGQWVRLAEAFLTAPNGSKWRLTVSNTGVLTTVAV